MPRKNPREKTEKFLLSVDNWFVAVRFHRSKCLMQFGCHRDARAAVADMLITVFDKAGCFCSAIEADHKEIHAGTKVWLTVQDANGKEKPTIQELDAIHTALAQLYALDPVTTFARLLR